MNKIKVVIADNRRDTRQLIKAYTEKDRFIKVIGEAENGPKALEMVMLLKPDILIIYYNMIEMDGYEVTEKITSELENTYVIMTSEKENVDLIKKAMFHGAKEYIITPFSPEVLNTTVRTVYEKESNKRSNLNQSPNADIVQSKVLSIFSTKGGVGKTTLAINTAVALYKKTREKIAIIDLDLQFGDVLLMVNKEPTETISDFINQCDEYSLENLKLFLHNYQGISILASPVSPEYAEYITEEHVNQIINLLRKEYKYIIIDNPNSFDDVTLAALDASDAILMITTMDIVSVKNVKIGLNVMKSLGYTDEKVNLVINKANQKHGIKLKDLKTVFDEKIVQVIVEDIKTVVTSINRGKPFVFSFSKTKVSRCIYKLVEQLK